MSFKDMLVPLTLALATTWGIQYLIGRYLGQSQEVRQSGQSFIAPKEERVYKPLNTEVDFIESKRPKGDLETIVETDTRYLVFTAEAASLDRLEMKKGTSGLFENITTIFPVANTQREDRCLLVALNEETPYFYTLESHKNLSNGTELIYRAPYKYGSIEKKYFIPNTGYSIDLELSIRVEHGAHVQPRIFFPAPLMPELADNDVIAGIMTDKNQALKTVLRNKLDPQEGWFTPEIFGTQDKYFVHVFLSDNQNFVQRAYYRFTNKTRLFSIIEGPEITKTTTWKTTFYFGPKEEATLSQADPRLTAVLSYSGWFAPISRLMLYILRFLYTYLHNFGLAIIVLTLIVRLLLLPFSLRGGNMKKTQAEFQKKLRYLEKRYKDDPEALARERAALIQKEGMPGLASCLPVLLQIPIFVGLSRVLSSSIELYHAPFYGWITDLAAPDPYYVLPLLICMSMLLNAAYVDQKQRMMMILMAFVIGAVTSSLSAGLVLYLSVSTLLGVAQARIFGVGA